MKHVYIGAAWPYANGDLHLGHVAGLIGGDVLARYHRLNGDKVLYVSGSDCHGTPVVVTAEREGISPKEVADKYHAQFVEYLVKGMRFSYDLYTTTMTDTHREVVQNLFLKLYEKGYIIKKTESLPYSEISKRFLPDRYIEGECPYCGFNNARGDQCDNCGKLLDPKDLINPKSKIAGDTPVWKDSEHFYLRLSAFEEQLKKSVDEAENWRPNAIAFSKNMIEEGLPDRPITRDTDWGIPIPIPGYESKRIYVWFEAVTGYLSACVQWSKDKGEPDAWKAWWESETDAYHYYTHGKDNVPFHTIIWPSMLLGYGNRHLPDGIVSTELLMLEGGQFSKSRNWAVWVKDILARYDVDSVRYYMIANGPERSDANFAWSDFQARHNNELVACWGNVVNRVVSLISKYYDGTIPESNIESVDAELLKKIETAYAEIGSLIEQLRFKEAVQSVFALADEVNKYINDHEPWKLIKTDVERTATVLATCATAVANISIMLEPFIPNGAEKVRAMFGIHNPTWTMRIMETGYVFPNKISLLYQKIEDEQIAEEKARMG